MDKARFIAAMAAMTWVAACGGGGGGSSPPPPPAPIPNRAPVAKAGMDITGHLAPAGTELDGSESSDKDGDELTFSWEIKTEPDGAGSTLSDAASPTPVLLTQTPGEYEIELTVTDPDGASGFDTVIVTLENDAPRPVLSVSLTTPALRENIELSAVDTTDPNGQPLSFAWTLESSPAGSTLPSSFDGMVQTVSFDVEGDYQFSLEVSDGFDTVRLDAPVISVTKFSIRKLPGMFGGKAVQPGGNRIIAAMQDVLGIFDDDAVQPALVSIPPSLVAAVSPDGHLAALLGEDLVTFVDLDAEAVVKSWPVKALLTSTLTISNQGNAFIFNPDSSTTDILSVNMKTGALTTTPTGYPTLSGFMDPSNQKIYVMSGLLPNELGRYTISGGRLLDYQLSATTDGLCGSGWIAGDGSSMLTYCGRVMRLSDDPATDMTELGRILDYGGGMQSATYSPFTKYWYVLGPPNDEYQSQILIYDSRTYEQIDAIELPMEFGTSGNQLVARLISASQDSLELRILATDHPTADKDHYMLVTPLDHPAGANTPPEVVLQKYSAGYAGEMVQLDASASTDPEGLPLIYSWKVVSEPNPGWTTLIGDNEAFVRVSTLLEGEYVLEVTVSDGVNEVSKQVTVQVSSSPEHAFYRLPGKVLDAEYSRPLNTLAYIVEGESALHLVELTGFRDRAVPLERQPYRVGLSPDGKQAAVSHSGLVSLVDVNTAQMIDSKYVSWDWGDIVLDGNQRLHTATERGDVGPLVTIDFTENSVRTFYNVSLGSQLRMHPTEDWIYGASTKTVPSVINKWNLNGLTVASAGSSASGTPVRDVGGNVWISEAGDRLLAASGDVFEASGDPSTDMIYIGTLPDGVTVTWADHSEARGQWAVAVEASSGAPELNGKIAFYDDTTLERAFYMEAMDVPAGSGRVPAQPVWLFLSMGGQNKLILTDNGGATAGAYTLEVVATSN
jgi:chitinase